MLRHWRIALLGWIVMGAAFLFDQTPAQSIVGLISLGIVPVSAILAARSLSSDFEIRSSSILRLLVCSVLYAVVVLGLPAILAAVLIPNLLHARAMGDTSIGPIAGLVVTIAGAAAFILWIGNKWSLASIVAFCRSRPVAASFGKSWALTTGMYWQTLLFNISATLAFAAVWFGSNFVAGVIIGFAYAAHRIDAATMASSMRHIPALFVPLLIYAEIAEWIAYIRWVDRLDSLRVSGERAEVLT